MWYHWYLSQATAQPVLPGNWTISKQPAFAQHSCREWRGLAPLYLNRQLRSRSCQEIAQASLASSVHVHNIILVWNDHQVGSRALSFFFRLGIRFLLAFRFVVLHASEFASPTSFCEQACLRCSCPGPSHLFAIFLFCILRYDCSPRLSSPIWLGPAQMQSRPSCVVLAKMPCFLMLHTCPLPMDLLAAGTSS